MVGYDSFVASYVFFFANVVAVSNFNLFSINYVFVLYLFLIIIFLFIVIVNECFVFFIVIFYGSFRVGRVFVGSGVVSALFFVFVVVVFENYFLNCVCLFVLM